jgi:polyphosphate glucokinase
MRQAVPVTTRTLAIDCGGTGLKALVLDERAEPLCERTRIRTPYPLSPERFVRELVGLAAPLPAFDRVTVGMPGMIRHGHVVATPHYPTVSGPFTEQDPRLLRAWSGFDVAAALGAAFGRPTLVLNDAEVQGAAVQTGQGLELVLTLGTGLGCAVFDDGMLAPHLELSHAPFRQGETYDAQLGNIARQRVGSRTWNRRLARAVDGLRPVFRFDRLYLGGGNAKHVRVDLGADVLLVPNTSGLLGGVSAWSLPTSRRT